MSDFALKNFFLGFNKMVDSIATLSEIASSIRDIRLTEDQAGCPKSIFVALGLIYEALKEITEDMKRITIQIQHENDGSMVNGDESDDKTRLFCGSSCSGQGNNPSEKTQRILLAYTG